MKNRIFGLIISVLFVTMILGYGFDIEVTTTETSDALLQELTNLPGKVFLSAENPETGTIHRVICSIPWEYDDSDRYSMILSALDFVSFYPQLFGNISPDELELVSARIVMGKWFLTFQQQKDGLAVLGSRADFRYCSGNLVLFGSTVYDLSSVNTSIALDENRVVEIVENKFNCEAEASGLYIVKNSTGDLVPAWWVDGRLEYPRSRPRVLVDANTGEIIDHYDNIRFGLEGTVHGEFIPRFRTDGPDTTVFPHLFVSCDLGIIDTTDMDGRYSFDASPDGRVIFAQLRGLYADVKMPGDERGSFTSVATGTPFDFLLGYGDFYYQEVNAYHHVTFIHDWYQVLDPDFSGMSYSVPVTVRDTVPPAPVNAYWDGEGIFMGRGGSGYDDFSFYAEIFYHEYGHGVNHNIYPRELLPYTGQPGAIDEALADYFACSITDDPEVGNGGLVPGGGYMRTHDNDLVYPDDWSDQVHSDGRIIGGAFWDLRSTIRVPYCDSLVHFARFGFPNRFDDFAWEILILDDDDGDLSTGTPHIMEIFDAFSRHGIGNFETMITHIPHHDTEVTDEPYLIEASIRSIFPMNPDRLHVYFRASGSDRWSDVLLVYDETEDAYFAEIPPFDWGTTVEYYLEAHDSAGTFDILPADAPEDYLSFFVGQDTIPPVLTSEMVTDQPLERHPFAVRCYAFDNYGISHVELSFAKNSEPFTTVLMDLDLSVDYTGRPARFDGLIEFDELEVGDTVFYNITAYDLAGEPNTASLPETGYEWFLIVPGIFIDFEADNGGFTARGGWEWGVPTVGPETTPSPDKCWGTVLDGNYENEIEYILTSPNFATADFASATLEFSHWYKMEWAYDGGIVEVSTDRGASWTPLWPTRGYPSTVAAIGNWGFTGSTEGEWRIAAFDLTNFLGNDMRFRLRFKSDRALNMEGWYIDNFAVLEKQVLAPPRALTATNGLNEKVRLNWMSPLENPLERPLDATDFRGYNVYRSMDGVHFTDAPVATVDFGATEMDVLGLTNGTFYYFYMTADYARGESQPSNIVRAMPFQATISVYPDEFDVILYEGDVLDTTMYIENLGTGWLEYLIVEDSDPPSSYRSFFDFNSSHNEVSRNMPTITAKSNATMDTPGDGWILIAEDPEEPGDVLDFAAFYYQFDSRNLYFMTTAHAPMGDYRRDYFIAIMFDTDLDPSTGFMDTGAEFFIALGALPMGNALVLKHNPESAMGFDMVGAPFFTYFSTYGDTVQVGIRRSDIESPSEANIYAIARPDMSSMIPEDMIPNEPAYINFADIVWIDETPKSSVVWADSGASEIIVTLDANYATRGVHHAWLRFITNDHDAEGFTVPVRLEVWGEFVDEATLPQELEIGSVYPNPFNAACRIEFSTPVEDDIRFEIHDVRGRLIFDKLYSSIPAGRHALTWDGTGEFGQPLPSGIYIIRVSNEHISDVQNVILMK